MRANGLLSRRRQRAIAVPAFVTAAVLVACGGDSQGRSPESVEWQVARIIGPRQAELVATLDYCIGDPKPKIERARVRYSDRRILIELFVVQEPRSDGVCHDVSLGIYKRIKFRLRLDDVELFDSSAGPPERRWP